MGFAGCGEGSAGLGRRGRRTAGRLRRLGLDVLGQAGGEVTEELVRDVLDHSSAAEAGQLAGDGEVGLHLHVGGSGLFAQGAEDRRPGRARPALVLARRLHRDPVRGLVDLLQRQLAAVRRGRGAELDREVAAVDPVVALLGDLRARQARRYPLHVDQRGPHPLQRRLDLEVLLELHSCLPASRSCSGVSTSAPPPRSSHGTPTAPTRRSRLRAPRSPLTLRTGSSSSASSTTGWPGSPP